MSSFQKLIGDLLEVDKIIKEAQDHRERLRREFFRQAKNLRDPENLPVKRVEIERDWFGRVEITEAEFLSTRYPGWILEDRKAKDDKTIFILRWDAEFLPYETVYGEYRIVKEVSSYQPQVDWDRLQKDDPELYYAIVDERSDIELDEDALATLVEEDPAILERVSRHLLVRKPSAKLSIRRKRQDHHEE